MADNTIKIGGELESMATGKIVAAASAIKDKSRNKTQEVINGDVEAAIAEQSAQFEELSEETSAAVASASQSARDAKQYLADLQEAITELPDGQAVSAQVAVNEVDIAGLKSDVVVDLSTRYATSYANLSAALTALNSDTAADAAAIKKGGVSIKFINSSTNKYEQWSLKASSWSTDTSDWSLNVDGSIDNGKIKLPTELVKPSSNEYVTQADQIGYGGGSVGGALDKTKEKLSDLYTDQQEDTYYITDANGNAIGKFDANGLTVTDVLVKNGNTLSNLLTLINNKVDVEVGKGLSANDFTNALKQSLEAVSATVLDEQDGELYITDSSGNVFASISKVNGEYVFNYAGKEDVSINIVKSYTNIGNRIVEDGYSLDVLGWNYANSAAKRVLIPCENNKTYTLFFPLLGNNGTIKVGIAGSNKVALGLLFSKAFPSSGDLDLTSNAANTFTYAERCYVKINSANAKYIVVGVSDYANSGVDFNEIGAYEGILYQDPHLAIGQSICNSVDNALCANSFKNRKYNVLLLGDSYWEGYSGDYFNTQVITNHLRRMIGVNHIDNFAQGGGRIIHSSETVDVTSYSDTYPNASAQNVFSNQFLKWKLHRDESPSDYPLPDVVFICGLTNNKSFYPAKFDENNFATVFVDGNNYDEEYLSGAFKRLLNLITDECGSDIPIVYIGSTPHYEDGTGDNKSYINYKMAEIVREACHINGVSFVDIMGCNMRVNDSTQYRDGLHPDSNHALMIARCVAQKLISSLGFDDTRKEDDKIIN